MANYRGNTVEALAFQHHAERSRNATPQGRKYKAAALTVLKQLQAVAASGDIREIMDVEDGALQFDLDMRVNSAGMQSSLEKALHDMKIARRMVDIVERPDEYGRIDAGYSRRESRVSDLPRDEARQFFKSHYARLLNLDKSGLDTETKRLLTVRRGNIAKAEQIYIDLQCKTLGKPLRSSLKLAKETRQQTSAGTHARMIAKSIQRRSGDNYGRLARYLAAASDPGEKRDDFWMVNCNAGDSVEDIEIGIIEIETTQALNTRASGDKTYHLILSFRNDKPDAAALRQIEWQFAAALGLAQHQRIAATHTNTDNFHMHIAINKVHPETLRCVTPFQDFKALEATCRAVEQQYGLSVDNGRAQTATQLPERPAGNAPVEDFEHHTWEQSFASWVKSHKGELAMGREEARSWEDLHRAFDRLNLGLRLRGNGLVIFDAAGGKFEMKGSDFGRNFSKAALTSQLGAFEEMKGPRQGDGRRYRRRPLTRHTGTSKAWRRFMRGSTMQGSHQKRDSLKRRLFGSWKNFLMTEAMTDPLALAILMMHRQLIGAITPSRNAPRPAGRVRPARRPVLLDDRFYLNVPFANRNEAKEAGASFDKKRKAWWVEKSDIDGRYVKWIGNGKPPVAPDDRFYLDVPFAERAQAKTAGALWDGKKKAWYRHSDDDSPALSKWAGDGTPPPDKPPIAKLEKIFIKVPYRDRAAAKAAGARWDWKADNWFYEKGSDKSAFTRWPEKAVEKAQSKVTAKR